MTGVCDNRLGKCGVVDFSGKVVIPFEYDDMLSGVNGFTVRRRDAWSILDFSGRTILGPVNHELGCVDENHAVPFRSGECWGLMKLSGEVVLSPEYARLDEAVNGIYLGYNFREYTLFNLEGTIRKEFHTEWLSYLGDYSRIGFYEEHSDRYGFASIRDEEGIPPIFEEVQGFSEGVAAVRLNGRPAFIDRSGKSLPTVQSDSLRSFSEGMAAFQAGGTWGFLSAPDTVIIEPRFLCTGAFSNGLCDVRTERGYGYIDPLGNMVIDGRFDAGGPFDDWGIASVLKNGRTALIARNGRTIWSS